MGSKNNKYYGDKTAQRAIKNAFKKTVEEDDRAHGLIRAIKVMCAIAGYEVTGRIQLRDNKTGKEWY